MKFVLQAFDDEGLEIKEARGRFFEGNNSIDHN